MKKITRFTVLFFLLTSSILHLAAQPVTTPRPSPAAELRQTLGLTDITVHYSRPQVIANGQDRTGKIWGQLVPYGFQKTAFGCQCEIPWRAGANENTTIEFSNDVTVEGKPLAAGKYGLHMAIWENNRATVIFSKNTSSWGSFWYNPAEDALRVDAATVEAPFTNVLTYEWVEVGPDYGVLALTWEKMRIPVRIGVDVREQALQAFREELRGVKGFGWQGPLSAANYCLQNNFNHAEAIQWADRAIAAAGTATPQPQLVKIGLLMQSGKKDDALAQIDQLAPKADVNTLNTLGYTVMQAGQIDKAIELFQLNVEKNPEVANCYDSLGEAYVAKGEKEKAIKAFKTSLSKNPPANVKTNSINNLKALGVEL